MAGYIGTKAVALSTTTGNILGDMTVGGTTDVATLEFNSLSGTGSVTITDILDEDNLASNSATKLATQQSIKAYVDSQVDTVDTLAEILAIGNRTSGTGKIEFRDAAIFINSSADGQLDLVADTEIQIAATTVDLNGALDVSGTALVTGVLTTTAKAVFNGGFGLPDSQKATFGGTGTGDLQIYHDGSNSYIDDAGTGRLYLRGNDRVQIQKYTGEDMITAIADGAVNLYHNNSKKIETTSTGVEVANSSGGATINISTDGAAGSTSSKKYNNLDFSGYNDNVLARIQSWDESSSTGHGYLTFHTFPAGGSLTERMLIDSTGQVYTTASLSAGANANMANGFVADTGAVYTRGTVSSNARSNNGGYLSGFAIVNGDNSANGGGAAGGRIVANVSAICITSDGNAGDDSGGDLVFSTKPEAGNLTERVRVFSSGGVTFQAGNFNLADGNLIIATDGHGINFAGPTAQSGGTSQTLDSYEEGAYDAVLTPASGSFVLDLNALSYTKIGRNVYINGRVHVSAANSPSGNTTISLPFASGQAVADNGDYNSMMAHTYGVNLPDDTIQTFWEISPNTSTGLLLAVKDNAVWENINANNIAVGDIIYVSGHYVAA
jgi:hypothetical protein